MIKNLEVKTYECCGVKVTVKIDYKNETVSVVEDTLGFPGKRYLFNERGLDYMDSWVDVLNALKFAVESATNELIEYKAEKNAEAEEFASIMMDKVAEAIKCEKDSKKKGLFSKK
ncbi:MAG: hypothetical protein WCX46_03255 [Candidatus Paceibacterota bacterium]